MKKPRIAVIGDIILDKYSYGAVTRISPEAPIPIIAVEKEVYKPGGAGNTAANLAALEADVDLFGVAGDDHYRDLLQQAISQFPIRARIVTDKHRPTIVKQRLISASQQMLRVDYEARHELAPPHLEDLMSWFDGPYDAIIVSDYAKGVVCPPLMEFLMSRSIPVYVDPKPTNAHLYRGVQLLKPNAKECLEMSGVRDDLEGARILSSKLETTVLLTRGGRGMALVEAGASDTVLVETEARDVVDVTGAGDTVIATHVFARCLGYEARDAIRIANAAAGIAVSKVGCYQVTREDLKEHLQ